MSRKNKKFDSQLIERVLKYRYKHRLTYEKISEKLMDDQIFMSYYLLRGICSHPEDYIEASDEKLDDLTYGYYSTRKSK